VDYNTPAFVSRWTLYVDPTNRQVRQVDYVEQKVGNPSAQPIFTMELKDFEYNIGVQDKKFASPDPEASSALKS
jgi:hypothetical protein